MQRRQVLTGAASALAVGPFPEAAKAAYPRTVEVQGNVYTVWDMPDTDRYRLGNGERGKRIALERSKDIFDQYGVYEDMIYLVLKTEPEPDRLRPTPRGVEGIRITRMFFHTGEYVPNLIVTPAALTSPRWTQKPKEFKVWSTSVKRGPYEYVIDYMEFEACGNPAVTVRTLQGWCLWDAATCGPYCATETLRKLQQG
jgi:hypothetical protein